MGCTSHGGGGGGEDGKLGGGGGGGGLCGPPVVKKQSAEHPAGRTNAYHCFSLPPRLLSTSPPAVENVG